VPVFPVLTKGDKLSRGMQKKQAAEFRRLFEFSEDPVVYSSLEYGSRALFWERFDGWRKKIGGLMEGA
jgi:GTP-binding protein EngB required for normal cell division